MLTKTSGYVKSYDGQTTWMYFFIEDNERKSFERVFFKIAILKMYF